MCHMCHDGNADGKLTINRISRISLASGEATSKQIDEEKMCPFLIVV